MTLALGSNLGPYAILAKIGAGGMGEVFRAKDPRLDREVAIKVLLMKFADEPERLQRFEQEARAASTLNHPSILTVHDFGVDDGVAYLVTEWLLGESLRKLLDKGPLSARRSIEFAVQIARGLSEAHEKGVVHRDLKPENLFVTREGSIKILDFGLARIDRGERSNYLENTSTLLETSPGTVLGTVGYMAPEQVRGELSAERSDLFSLGILLYEMLTGINPFKRDSAVESLYAILNDEPADLASPPWDLNPGLVRIVSRLLAKDPNRRFRSAHDLIFGLEELVGNSSSYSNSNLKVLANLPKDVKRWHLPFVVVLLLLVSGLGVKFWQNQRLMEPYKIPVSFEVFHPENSWFSGNTESHNVALSPNGHTLAFVAGDQSTGSVYLRNLNPQDLRVESDPRSQFLWAVSRIPCRWCLQALRHRTRH